MYLLLSYINFLNNIQPSLQQILSLLQMNLFERRDLLGLLRGDPLEPHISTIKLLCYSHESLWDSSEIY